MIRYDIVDSTGTRNSNWAYNILEDNSGRLWIATCLGGIFVVDRDKLPANGGRYVADYNFCKENGLSGVFINQIVADKNNDIWVLLYNNGINKINSSTFEVIKIDIDAVHVNSNPNYIIADKEGKIWSAYRGGIMYIDPAENIPHYIDFSFSDNESPTANVNTEVLSMTEVENEIWVSTSDGVWIVNKDTYKTDRIGNSGKTYISNVSNNEAI